VRRDGGQPVDVGQRGGAAVTGHGRRVQRPRVLAQVGAVHRVTRPAAAAGSDLRVRRVVAAVGRRHALLRRVADASASTASTAVLTVRRALRRYRRALLWRHVVHVRGRIVVGRVHAHLVVRVRAVDNHAQAADVVLHDRERTGHVVRVTVHELVGHGRYGWKRLERRERGVRRVGTVTGR